jgi:hypothetical protein
MDATDFFLGNYLKRHSTLHCTISESGTPPSANLTRQLPFHTHTSFCVSTFYKGGRRNQLVLTRAHKGAEKLHADARLGQSSRRPGEMPFTHQSNTINGADRRPSEGSLPFSPTSARGFSEALRLRWEYRRNVSQSLLACDARILAIWALTGPFTS